MAEGYTNAVVGLPARRVIGRKDAAIVPLRIEASGSPDTKKGNVMNLRQTMLLTAAAAALSAAFAVPAFAQGTASETQRDINQQQRIENGLKGGQLTTGEAAKLEKGEARINRMQAHAEADGKLSAQEKAKIQQAQNKESAKIDQAKHNGIVGNPNSASSQRMQADVQRNVNQEKRIEQGVKSGELTKREVGSLEKGQAHVDAAEAHVGKDGHVSAKEQARVQARENHQSKRIFKEKHNAKVAG
ncbi:hypothetical protein GCM10027419_44230 [Pandoraea terrae]